MKLQTNIPEDPRKIGLPFDKWRTFQPGVIDGLIKAVEPYKALIAPTGSGKSAIAAGVTRLTANRSVVLTKTKQLQAQYVDSFPDFAAELIGMQNFACLIDDVAVPQAPCQYGFQCPVKNDCDYFQQRAKAVSAQMVVTNYDYALNSINSIRSPLLGRDMLICDEGHELDEVLTGYMAINPTKKQVEMLNGFPKSTSVDKWQMWAQTKMDEWKPEYQRLNAAIQAIAEHLNSDSYHVSMHNVPPENKPIVQRFFQVRPIYTLLQRVLDNLNDQWVISWKELPQLKPLWVNEFAGEFFSNWRDITMMSATLPKRKLLADLLGLDAKLIYEAEVESLFPRENRRIIYKPVAYMSKAKWEDGIVNIMKVINAVIEGKPNDKILIHTHNYEITKAVVSGINAADRVLTHLDSANRTEIARLFSNTKEPLVFVTPSFTSGLDVPDLKYNIIVKTMFPDLGDPWIRKRQTLMPDWYTWRTVADVCQAIGRTPRIEGVQGQTLILDAMFGEVLWKNGEKYFPDYIKEAIEW